MNSPIIYGPNQVAENLVTGGLQLPGSTSGNITITAPAAPTTYTLTLPTAVPGTTGSVLTSDTSGVTSFVAQLPIANGGTGQTTANNALNALLPVQSGDGFQALVSNGTTTSWANPLLEVSIFDDFTWAFEESNFPAGPLAMAPYGNAAGGPLTPGNVPVSVTTGRWGVIGFTTGTNNNNTGAGAFGSDYGQYYCGQAQTMTLTGAFNIPVLATVGVDYAIEMGFRSTINNGLQPNSIVILYQRATSLNWLGYTSNNNVSTTVTSSLLVTTGWWNFKIVITATTVDFYIATPGSAYTHIGQSTTNLPDSTHTAFLNGLIYKASTTATASKMYVDWWKVDLNFASTR